MIERRGCAVVRHHRMVRETPSFVGVNLDARRLTQCQQHTKCDDRAGHAAHQDSPARGIGPKSSVKHEDESRVPLAHEARHVSAGLPASSRTPPS